MFLYSRVSKVFLLNLFYGFQSKAAKELAENRSKIDALLDWVTGVGSTGRQMEQLSGAGLGKGAMDTTDGHRAVNQALEELDKQCEKMKVRMLACPHDARGSLPPQASHHNLLARKFSAYFSVHALFDTSAALTPLKYCVPWFPKQDSAPVIPFPFLWPTCEILMCFRVVA